MVDDRLKEAGAPPNGRAFNAIGAGQCAATVLGYGSEDQKQRYLPWVFTGEAKWCQLFSEPGSGSDLASLATRAVRDGDEWVVNGQKVWTSGAQDARYALLLARTDPDAEKHAGLTAFVIDMHAPGVEVRPLRQMNGGADFSEVFISDVRIPDSERLGDVGTGWAVSHHTLVQERYNMPRIPNRGEGQISVVMRAWEQRADKTSATRACAQGPSHAALDRGRGVAPAPSPRRCACAPQAGAGRRVRSASSSTSVVGRRLAEFAPSLLGPDALLIDGYENVGSMMRRDMRREGPHAITRSFVGQPGHGDRRRHRPDPAQHHRRPRARAAP